MSKKQFGPYLTPIVAMGIVTFFRWEYLIPENRLLKCNNCHCHIPSGLKYSTSHARRRQPRQLKV